MTPVRRLTPFVWGIAHERDLVRFPATFLILKGVQDASERSVVPASQPTASAREPLDQPSRFGLTPAPQALSRPVVATTQDGHL
jgi:hypothetical protein